MIITADPWWPAVILAAALLTDAERPALAPQV